MESQLPEAQRAALRVVCDTVVPSIHHEPDPHGLWARSATAIGVDVAAEQMLLGLPPEPREGMGQLLEAIAGMQLEGKSQASREQAMRNIALTGGAAAAAGIGGLVSMVLLLNYGLPDPQTGQNPNWSAFGYPGPHGAPPPRQERITPTVPEGDLLELEADVVLVGSGAGGGVIAGELAQQGLRVVVVEAGPYLTEADFSQLELPAYQQAYWRGGPQQSADLNITMLAGSTLGGGTTVNWTNCLRTRSWVRDEWAAAGLEDVGTDFERHLDAVWERLGVTEACSDRNGTQERMQAGADALGWHASVAARNVDPERYDVESAGYLGFGDQSGAKRSTLNTYLQDAFDAGAKLVPDTFVERVVADGGVAEGIEGTWRDRVSGRTARVVVRAPQVVVAAGSLESPALLLRSGIGGEHVGRHLRLHPTIASAGIYAEDLKAWRGAPHAFLVDEFEEGHEAEGYGFRIEGTQYAPGLIGSATPWRSGADHKRWLSLADRTGVFLGRIRDHGEGTITLDDAGQAQVHYAVTDPVDVATLHRAIAALAKLQVAAGASELTFLGQNAPVWRTGDDVDAFIRRVQRMPLRAGGLTLFTAHQMGSCRMGADPAENVADARGELHDTKGVWIGDASAFPTASGTNPMISIMALAHRTAEAIAHHAGVQRQEVPA